LDVRFFFFFCIVFKIVNTERKKYLKLGLDSLENRKQNWEYMFGKVNQMNIIGKSKLKLKIKIKNKKLKNLKLKKVKINRRGGRATPKKCLGVARPPTTFVWGWPGHPPLLWGW
jgi:hypothetical protein